MAIKTRSDLELLAEIGLIDRMVAGRLERALPDGLSAASFEVLNHFALAGAPSNPLALAEALHVGKSAMTHTLQRLETQGLVSVSEDASDRRRKVVALTAAGAETQRAAMIAARPPLEALRQAFGADEFETALPFLRSLREWLEENH